MNPTNKDSAEATEGPVRKPRQARAQARMNAILETAESLLQEGGIEAVTTTSLAQTAQIPVGSVYRYFRDRDDILWQVYRGGYEDVMRQVRSALRTLPPNLPFRISNKVLLDAFWLAARKHPTFRTLTRWANGRSSLWDVTPGSNSSLPGLVEASLGHANVAIDPDRKEVVIKTTVTALSILIDQALEEEDETKAGHLMEELARLISAYIEKSAV